MYMYIYMYIIVYTYIFNNKLWWNCRRPQFPLSFAGCFVAAQISLPGYCPGTEWAHCNSGDPKTQDMSWNEIRSELESSWNPQCELVFAWHSHIFIYIYLIYMLFIYLFIYLINYLFIYQRPCTYYLHTLH